MTAPTPPRPRFPDSHCPHCQGTRWKERRVAPGWRGYVCLSPDCGCQWAMPDPPARSQAAVPPFRREPTFV